MFDRCAHENILIAWERPLRMSSLEINGKSF